MRLATILPRASVEAVPVVAAPDGTWIELAGLIGREATRLEAVLPWLLAHGSHVPDRAAKWKGPRYRPSEFSFLPPVVRPPVVREFEAFRPGVHGEPPRFFFANPHALAGHNAQVVPPAGCAELDFGFGLGAIIGHGARDIAPARAWDHVIGFTIVNATCARDLERAERAAGLGPAKARDFSTTVGPWLVTRDEFALCLDGEELTLNLSARLNGRELARGDAAKLTHSIPQLIAQASRDADLYPGDLIVTGAAVSLAGLGAVKASEWLQPGDVVELEVERLGLLRTRIGARK
jgi:fumarylacetoacetate (FAA) hydrolase